MWLSGLTCMLADASFCWFLRVAAFVPQNTQVPEGLVNPTEESLWFYTQTERYRFDDRGT